MSERDLFVAEGVLAWFREQRCSHALKHFGDGRTRFRPRPCRNPAGYNGRCRQHQDVSAAGAEEE